MTHALPHSTAAERNAGPILAVLREQFAGCRRVLEIGSGTGQHAVHFAAALPHLAWQASDVPDYQTDLRARIAAAALDNLPPPLVLDVAQPGSWPASRYDAVFTANTLHIMGWPEVQALFAQLPAVLAAEATVVAYGPFNRGGRFTSASNALFDAQLRRDAPGRGIRDVEAVQALAAQAGLVAVADVAMPANNACLVWRR